MLEPAGSISHDVRWEIIIHDCVFQEILNPHKCVPFSYALSVNMWEAGPQQTYRCPEVGIICMPLCPIPS